MVAQSITNIFTSLILVRIICHRVLGHEFVASAIDKAANPLDGVLCSCSPDKCHILAPIRSQSFGTLTEDFSTCQVVGTDEGKSSVLKLRSIKIGVDCQDLDPLLLQRSQFIGDCYVVGVNG